MCRDLDRFCHSGGYNCISCSQVCSSLTGGADRLAFDLSPRGRRPEWLSTIIEAAMVTTRCSEAHRCRRARRWKEVWKPTTRCREFPHGSSWRILLQADGYLHDSMCVCVCVSGLWCYRILRDTLSRSQRLSPRAGEETDWCVKWIWTLAQPHTLILRHDVNPTEVSPYFLSFQAILLLLIRWWFHATFCY